MKSVVFSVLSLILILSFAGFVLAQENLTCTDSDNGINYYISGNVRNSSTIFQDSCVNSDLVTEYYCSNNKPAVTEYSCSYGCSNGACLQNTNITATCTDSDGGRNYFVIGKAINERGAFIDTCIDDLNNSATATGHYLIEYSCTNGKEEYVCENGCSNGACLREPRAANTTEQVVCAFKRSHGKEFQCYSDNGRFGCTANNVNEDNIRYCKMEVSGFTGEKMIWKSTCGGYQYTLIDGDDETVTFNCLANNETFPERIKEHYFRAAFWQCYDGSSAGQTRENDEFDIEENDRFDIENHNNCRPSEVWQKYAKEFCEEHCSKETGKCGVNSFAVAKECYPEQKDIPIDIVIANESIKAELICKDSCPLDKKCYPFGYRKSGLYCSDSGSFVKQIEPDKRCDNNFECSSNICVSNKCLSPGLIERILNFFKRFFGAEQ